MQVYLPISLNRPRWRLACAVLAGGGCSGAPAPVEEAASEVPAARSQDLRVERSIFPVVQQSQPEPIGTVPAFCPPREGPYPMASAPDTTPVLALFSDGRLPEGSRQIAFSFNDDGNMKAATPESFSCDDLTEGSQAYRFVFEPSGPRAPAFAFAHTRGWLPLNLANTDALQFDVKTPVNFNVYIESLDETGRLIQGAVPIDRYAELDNTWQSVFIPMRDFLQVNTSRVIVPFGIHSVAEPGVVLFDHIRFSNYQENAPPQLSYQPEHHLAPEIQALTIPIAAADPDQNTLTWTILAPPSNGTITIEETEAGASVIYQRTLAASQDAFELKVEDGRGSFFLLPFIIRTEGGERQPIALFSDQAEGRYAPLTSLLHWNGGARAFPDSRRHDRRELTLEGGYGNGALIFEMKYGIPLDITRHQALRMDFWWSSVDETEPVFKVIFESEGATRDSPDRRHEIVFEAEEDVWTPVSIDIGQPFERDTNKLRITRILLYTWNNADIRVDDLRIEL